MYKLLVKNGFTKIHFHIITDGRDTYPKSAYKYIYQNSQVEESKILLYFFD